MLRSIVWFLAAGLVSNWHLADVDAQPPGYYAPGIYGAYPYGGIGGGLGPAYQSYYGGPQFGGIPAAPLIYPPYPIPAIPAYGYVAPRSVLISTQVVAAPALPPARLVLIHRRNETLRVEIYDRQKKQSIFRQNIPAGGTVEVSLPRDAGGYVNETYRTVGPYGEPIQKNVTRLLPQDVRYDVTVHQWQIQSIAIDRTGKSPSPIEDVQFQGRRLGRFSLPPGDKLTDGQVDVYRSAASAGNSGLVEPIQPTGDNDGPNSDPLRDVFEGLRRGPRN